MAVSYGAQLCEESIRELNVRPGAILRGTVIAIGRNVATIDVGVNPEGVGWCRIAQVAE